MSSSVVLLQYTFTGELWIIIIGSVFVDNVCMTLSVFFFTCVPCFTFVHVCIHHTCMSSDDVTRCRLSFIPGVDGSDYINANLIAVSYLLASFIQTIDIILTVVLCTPDCD